MAKIMMILLTAAFLLFMTIQNIPAEIIQPKQPSDNEEMLTLLDAMESTISDVKEFQLIEEMKFHIDGNNKIVTIYLTVDNLTDNLQIDDLKDKISKLFLHNIAEICPLYTYMGGGLAL